MNTDIFTRRHSSPETHFSRSPGQSILRESEIWRAKSGELESGLAGLAQWNSLEGVERVRAKTSEMRKKLEELVCKHDKQYERGSLFEKKHDLIVQHTSTNALAPDATTNCDPRIIKGGVITAVLALLVVVVCLIVHNHGDVSFQVRDLATLAKGMFVAGDGAIVGTAEPAKSFTDSSTAEHLEKADDRADTPLNVPELRGGGTEQGSGGDGKNGVLAESTARISPIDDEAKIPKTQLDTPGVDDILTLFENNQTPHPP